MTFLLSGLTWVINWMRANKRTVAILAAILVIALLAIVFTRSCSQRSPINVDEGQLNKIKSENKAERIKELTTVVEENANTITTVDGRTTLAETNTVERNAEVDARVRDANLKIERAKAEGKDVTAQELNCILTGVCE